MKYSLYIEDINVFNFYREITVGNGDPVVKYGSPDKYIARNDDEENWANQDFFHRRFAAMDEKGFSSEPLDDYEDLVLIVPKEFR